MLVNVSDLITILLQMVLLAMLVERALALVFEHRLVALMLDGRGLKELIALGVCWSACSYYSFDVIAHVTGKLDPQSYGQFLTALAIAGGSKASIKLFQDFLGLKTLKGSTP